MTTPAQSTPKRLRRVAIWASAGLMTLAVSACTGDGANPAPSPTPTTTTGTPTPTPEPTIKPTPPPLKPGNDRGRMIFVQTAEDASLVSGGQPIRLTLTRTANLAQWFSAPPQRFSGSITSQNLLATLGWRPAGDGSTAALPNPKPQALLTHAEGGLALTIQRASVRADGTLVLDIRPVGPEPATVSSFGPVTLTIDGVPGVRVTNEQVTEDLNSNVVVSGARAGQALVQLTDGTGELFTERYVSADEPDEFLGDIDTDQGAQLREANLQFRAPTKDKPGRLVLTARVVAGGVETPLRQVLARWTLPANAAADTPESATPAPPASATATPQSAAR